ncbi:MAG: KilA-N domain-containing protein [Conchiformibius sp.]|nr:KilA-N domain-containing protein [Conchiformibius sp.]
MNPIAINQIQIRQTNGLYCLNDLHRAAGNEKRHQPSDWLKNQQTKELIAELDGKPSIQENQSLNPTTGIFGVEQNQQVIQVVNGGDRRGTYVCRELVYAYAMWISPRFHLAVIRAFDALVSGSLKQIEHQDFVRFHKKMEANNATPAIPQTLPEALRLAADLAEQNQHQQARLAVAEPKAAAFDVLSGRNDAYNITLVAKHLNMGRNALIAYLRAHQWIYGKSPIMATAKAVKAGDMIQVNGVSERNGVDYTQALITSKGQAKLAKHFAAERQS